MQSTDEVQYAEVDVVGGIVGQTQIRLIRKKNELQIVKRGEVYVKTQSTQCNSPQLTVDNQNKPF